MKERVNIKIKNGKIKMMNLVREVNSESLCYDCV